MKKIVENFDPRTQRSYFVGVYTIPVRSLMVAVNFSSVRVKICEFADFKINFFYP